jgi:hypothetical protein
MKKLVLAIVLASTGVCCFEANSSSSALDLEQGTGVNLEAEKHRVRNEMNDSEIIRAVVRRTKQKYQNTIGVDKFKPGNYFAFLNFVERIASASDPEWAGTHDAARRHWFGSCRDGATGIIGARIYYLSFSNRAEREGLDQEIGRILGIDNWWHLYGEVYCVEEEVSQEKIREKYELAVFFLEELFYEIFGVRHDEIPNTKDVSFFYKDSVKAWGEGARAVLENAGFFNK